MIRSLLPISTAIGNVEFFHLPGPEPCRDLFGESVRVRRSFQGQRRQVTGKLVMAVTIGRCAVPPRHDYCRPETPNRLDHVSENRFLAPEARTLLATLGKAEVVGSRE